MQLVIRVLCHARTQLLPTRVCTHVLLSQSPPYPYPPPPLLSFAPLYGRFQCSEAAVLTRIRTLTRIPYFLSDEAPNFKNIMASPEMWLSAKKAGAKAHADEHCEATMSVQLSGTKRWRIGPMPPTTAHNFTKRRSLSDGVLTMTTPTWEPEYVFDLHPVSPSEPICLYHIHVCNGARSGLTGA